MIDDLEALRRDAERYRCLREMSWFDSPLAVVTDPRKSVRLGVDCPSHERLDEMVDDIIRRGKD